MIYLKIAGGVYMFAACFISVALWLTEPNLPIRDVLIGAFTWPWILGSDLYAKFKWRIRQYKRYEPKRSTKRDPPRYELN